MERFEEDGVEVVMSHRPRWSGADGWRLAPEPVTVIGEDTDEVEYLFSPVRGPERLTDGRIVAGDGDSREVRFFSASGEFEKAVGSPGQGPGEFGRLRRVPHCAPDRVIAMDSDAGLSSLIDASGEFLGRVPFEANAGFSFYRLTCNRAGQVLGFGWGGELAGGRRESFYRTTVSIRLLDIEFHVEYDFGEFPGVDRFGTTGGSGPHPLGKTTALALATDRAYIGMSDTFEIEVYSLEGDLLRRIRRQHETAPIDNAMIERHIASETAGAEPQRGEEIAIWIRNLPMPETFPAYDRFLLDTEGNLWIENYRLPGQDRRYWSVFDSEGVWLSDVDVPSTFEATEIGTEWMLGIFRNELDEQSIRQYRLER